MKALFYYLRRYKTATLLHLLGLSMALAAFYLFMTQVKYNNTFNHSLKDYQRTYRVECREDSKWYPSLPAPLKELWGQIPHIEEITLNKCGAVPLNIKVGENLFQTGLSTIDKNTLDFWGIHLLPGSNSWKEQPDGYIISESLARQIFGTENPVGKKFAIPQWNSENLTIIGVCQDFAENCSFENGLFQCYQESWFQSMSECNNEIYLRLDNPENKEQAEKEIGKLYKERFGEETKLQFRLIPMDRAYFEGSAYADKGNESLVYVLQAASIFILIIGLLNFTNFSLAQTPVRMRSINTRKVMGSTTASLRLGMILENVFWSVVALIGAILLILLFQKSPECMKLVSGNISLQTHGGLVCITLFATLGIGVLSTLFSSWYATSFPPALVLKGSFGLSPRGKMLRWTMLTVQFIVAFVMTLYVLVMTGQTHYIFNADYGFNKDEVLYAQLPYEALSKKEYLRQEITKLPFAENCSFAESVLGSTDGYMSWGRGSGNHRISFQALCVWTQTS
jgi:putative ABC transport system permease protein